MRPATTELVRELNSGTIARECVCFGIHRLSIPGRGADQREYLTVGDVVEFKSFDGAEDGQVEGDFRCGVVVAIFVDSTLERLCVAVRPTVSCERARRATHLGQCGDQPAAVEPCSCGQCLPLWEVLEQEEVVPVRDIVRKLSGCGDSSRSGGSEAPPVRGGVPVCGTYDAQAGQWHVGLVTKRASTDVNPDNLPVINLGLRMHGVTCSRPSAEGLTPRRSTPLCTPPFPSV